MTTNAMSCDLFGNQLMAYLEHEVDDATRIAIERHSLACAECGALLADLRKLRIDAANLPPMQPSRDLWSGIATRIEAPVVDIGTAREAAPRRGTRMRRWLNGAMIAASLVGAAGIGYVAAGARANATQPMLVVDVPVDTVTQIVMVPDTIAVSVPAGPTAPSAQAPVPGPQPAVQRPTEAQIALAALTADYDREIARLRTLLEQRRNQLDPVTVATIEKNLKVIDTAIEDSKKAIARDPASRFLMESLNQSLQTKVELMRTAALLPSRT
jgi:anti-sigma factor RsiW